MAAWVTAAGSDVPTRPSADPSEPGRRERHYNNRRPHRTLGQAAPLRPLPQPTTKDPNTVQRRDRLGGLLHEYQQVA